MLQWWLHKEINHIYTLDCNRTLQAMPGAVKVLTAADIPSNGKNNFTNWQGYNPEEVSVIF